MNKKVFQVGMLIIAIAVALPFTTSAFGGMNTKPMGGQIFMTTMPGVTCAAAAGPFFMMSAAGPAGPYIITATTNGSPKENGYILGLYNSQQNTSSCYTDTTPPVSVSVYEMTSTYGVSK